MVDAVQLAAPPQTHTLQRIGDVNLCQSVEPQDQPLREGGDQRLRAPGTPRAAADQFAAKLHELQCVGRCGNGTFLRHPQTPKPGAERPHRVMRNLVEPSPFDRDLPCADCIEVAMVSAIEELSEFIGFLLRPAFATCHVLHRPETGDMLDEKTQLIARHPATGRHAAVIPVRQLRQGLPFHVSPVERCIWREAREPLEPAFRPLHGSGLPISSPEPSTPPLALQAACTKAAPTRNIPFFISIQSLTDFFASLGLRRCVLDRISNSRVTTIP
ncbi:hypothetical protein QFZ42_005557 [Variovorax paradoxus]|nr:hypothetical protein [Variovorax paradoxus]